MLKFTDDDYDKMESMQKEVWVKLIPRKEAERTLSKAIENFIAVLHGEKKYEKGIEKILKHAEFFFRIDLENGGEKFNKISYQKKELSDYWNARYKIGKNNSHVYEFELEISLEYVFALVIHLASSPYALGKERVEQIVQEHNIPLDLFAINEVNEII
ncbi:hypothetical protein [Selenomonas ruminantium]|uniref:Uncharacterized protein n=1 Tax=Selenomonas ruminantium TaxID=971 RepID=A0A1I0YDT1_SELRU|nr:hypothetical protein [Selenomonas ruminantium]SFB10946.1 hypothetical protein SAMN05216587_111113 [Selenomonas ruminantium]